MEVHCPVVKPTLVAISDHGKTTLDFGEVSLGQTIIKSVTIQNISKKTIEVSFDLYFLISKIPCVNIYSNYFSTNVL